MASVPLDALDRAELARLAHAVTATRLGAHLCCVSADVAAAALAHLERQLDPLPTSRLDLATTTGDDLVALLDDTATGVSHLLGQAGVSQAAWNVLEARRDEVQAHPAGLRFVLHVTPRQETELGRRVRSLSFSSRADVGWPRQLRRMGDGVLRGLRDLRPRVAALDARLTEEVRRPRTRDDDFLVVLRRWNSFSPLLRHRPAAHEEPEAVRAAMWRELSREVRGGGYLLRWAGTSVAVDPGHDFIENLYRAGFGVADIDAVVVTHDHADHVADLLPLLDLLYQHDRRSPTGGPGRSVALFLAPTVHRRFSAVASWSEQVAGAAVRLPTPPQRASRAISVGPGLALRTLHASHVELAGRQEATSVRFELTGDDGRIAHRIGLSGDTAWTPRLAGFLGGCDLVVLHLGSVRDHELDEARPYPTHLGILGVYRLLEQLADGGTGPTVLLSEFGEELRGARDVLARDLMSRHEAQGIRVLPADIGHRLDLRGHRVRVRCGHPGCSDQATVFYEDAGEIRLRCPRHAPHPGSLGTAS